MRPATHPASPKARAPTTPKRKAVGSSASQQGKLTFSGSTIGTRNRTISPRIFDGQRGGCILIDMKAPPSTRSKWLGRVFVAGIAIPLIGNVISNLIVLIFDVNSFYVMPVLARDYIGIPLTALWLATGLAYLVARLNDGWDQEARQRRAQGSFSSLP
jgi:hypothetical protein